MKTNPLLTDLYQLTMAQGYFLTGRADDEAEFHAFFRTAPFGGEHAIACGMRGLREYLDDFEFTPSELAALGTLRARNGAPLFRPDFLNYLRRLRLRLEVEAMPEGTKVLPKESLARVRGPLLQCQLIETALLNRLNFETLIATKAARICAAAGPRPVIEMGLRRAHGPDGALSASRAAFVGGCAATSNVLAALRYGIPVRGTHAHSWVMAFGDEREAFRAWLSSEAGDGVLLVDTYSTAEGVKNAIAAGREFPERFAGIRLDSGNLRELSRMARGELDAAGFHRAEIVVSNDLDERPIAELVTSAPIDAFGVGTKLVTAYDQPALGGVYKLVAVRRPGEEWRYPEKVSDDPEKAYSAAHVRGGRAGLRPLRACAQ